MYTLYGVAASRAFRVGWMLEEIGVEYDVVSAGPRSAEIRAVNPAGKIPALEVEGQILTDSVAIMTFLGDRHGQLTFPCGTLERARQDALTHSINEELDSILWTRTKHSFILPDERRVAEVIPSLDWEFVRNVNRLAERFEGPFLMGDTMTHADILATHCLNWAKSAQIPVDNRTMIDFAKRMNGRDAVARARKRLG